MHLITHMEAVFVSEYGQGVGNGFYDECDHALQRSIPVYAFIKGIKGYYHLLVIRRWARSKPSPMGFFWKTYYRICSYLKQLG
jgi:hypothetical protein